MGERPLLLRGRHSLHVGALRAIKPIRDSNRRGRRRLSDTLNTPVSTTTLTNRGVVRAPLAAHALDGAAGLTRVNEIRCRPAGVEDFTFLATMLGEAAVWRPDKPTPTAEQVMADPRYALY